jgi:nitrite reductase (cytochrome c-552)
MLDAIVAAKKAGAAESDLSVAAGLHRKAQWRLDFVAAENSMGFHAPQEMARLLGETIDFARQGQLQAERAERKK